ncbi:MAG: hypothetical protein OXG88_03230 [Gammaproteobacteria bacterium]|nr:hypothetical protein [Gammaproteobacteria bacterium]
MCINLCESLKSYFGDTTVKGAVDSILENKFSIPQDIDWPDLPGLHKAVLAAYQVRCDFALFLLELWDSVWQASLTNSDLGGELVPITLQQTQESGDMKFDPENIWNDRWYQRSFETTARGKQYELYLGIEVSRERHPNLQLYLYLWDCKKEEDVTKNLDMMDAQWQTLTEEEGQIGYTKSLASYCQDGKIDLVRLQETAKGALLTIYEHFRQ